MASVLVDKERKHLNTLIAKLRAKVGTTGYPLSAGPGTELLQGAVAK